jgi:hypothetical protein
MRKEPAVASVPQLAPIHLGLDVHRDAISVAILAPDEQVPVVDRIPHDEASVRRLVGRLGNPRRLRASSKPVGPCGCQIFGSRHPTCAYSWTGLPSRSRRTTLPASAKPIGSPVPSGGACPKARCGRWPL